MNKTLYFSYSTVFGLDSPEPPNSPYSITWNLGRFLRVRAAERGYDFQYRNLDDTAPVKIGKRDIIIGHSWYPDGFLTSTLDADCKARFLIQPYQHDIVGVNESPWIKNIAARCEHLFFVTGPYWWDTMDSGLYGAWKDKATRLDMAINPALHLHSKTTWGKPGKRRFLAIGADIPYKGLAMIADLARHGGFHLGYFGNAPRERFAHVPQFMHYGGQEFTVQAQAAITSEYDFFLSLATGDACPTTLLETTSWGMLAACNQESGYWPGQPFVELQKDKMRFNLEVIDELQSMTEYHLNRRVAFVRQQIIERHGWAKFCETVWNKIESYL